MATATKPRGKSTRTTTARKGTTTAAPAATTPADQAVAASNQQSLLSTLKPAELFLADGTFTKRDVFRFNKVEGGALLLRQTIFRRIAQMSKAEILDTPRPARNVMFALCRNELARYYGTATRRQDNPTTGAKAGEPLPKLAFPTPQQAVSYRMSITEAYDVLKKAVFADA